MDLKRQRLKWREKCSKAHETSLVLCCKHLKLVNASFGAYFDIKELCIEADTLRDMLRDGGITFRAKFTLLGKEINVAPPKVRRRHFLADLVKGMGEIVIGLIKDNVQ